MFFLNRPGGVTGLAEAYFIGSKITDDIAAFYFGGNTAMLLVWNGLKYDPVETPITVPDAYKSATLSNGMIPMSPEDLIMMAPSDCYASGMGGLGSLATAVAIGGPIGWGIGIGGMVFSHWYACNMCTYVLPGCAAYPDAMMPWARKW